MAYNLMERIARQLLFLFTSYHCWSIAQGEALRNIVGGTCSLHMTVVYDNFGPRRSLNFLAYCIVGRSLTISFDFWGGIENRHYRFSPTRIQQRQALPPQESHTNISTTNNSWDHVWIIATYRTLQIATPE